MTALPSPGDSEYRLLQKLLMNLGGTVRVGDEGSRVLWRIVEAAGGQPHPGDTMRDLWRRFAVARGVIPRPGASIHDLLRLVVTDARQGDTVYKLIWKLVVQSLGGFVPATTWTPAQLTNWAWFKADAGITLSGADVTGWADQSGNARHMSGVAGKYPTLAANELAGLPVVRFASANASYLTTGALTLAQPCSVYVLARNRVYAQFQRLFGGFTDAYFYASNTVAPNVSMRTGGTVGPTVTDWAVNTFGSLFTHWNGLSSKQWKDCGVTRGGTPGTAAFGGFVAGAGPSPFALSANVDFAEIIIREGVDSNLDQRLINNYFQARSGGDYRQLVAEGDSLTQGAGLAEANLYPIKFIALRAPTLWGYYPAAVGGASTFDVAARAATIDSLYDTRLADNWLTLLVGHNDIDDGSSPESIFLRIRDYCLKRRASGWKVGICTMLPSTSVGFNEKRNQVNQLIRGNWSQFSNVLIDLAADPSIGLDSSAANATYYFDGTHMTAAGQTVYANLVHAAIP